MSDPTEREGRRQHQQVADDQTTTTVTVTTNAATETPTTFYDPPQEAGYAVNGSFQLFSGFQSEYVDSTQNSQTFQPMSGTSHHQMSVNGLSAQSSQQRVQMMTPTRLPPIPPTTADLGQTPSDLSTHGQMPPMCPTLSQAPLNLSTISQMQSSLSTPRFQSQFPQPYLSSQSSNLFANTPGSMNNRPPVSSNFPLSSRPETALYNQGSPTSNTYTTGAPSGVLTTPPQVLLHPAVNITQINSSAPCSTGLIDTASDITKSRQNELPVPFHGQGQYSRQINPFMLKTPDISPSNSGPPSQSASRGSSPVSGSAIDALEGQFIPGCGESSPACSEARKSPTPNYSPDTRPKSTGSPLQVPLLTESVSQQVHGHITSSSHLSPSWPEFPSMSQPNQQPLGHGQLQSQQPSLFYGQRTPQATELPPSAAGHLGGTPPVTNIQSRIPPPPTPGISHYPQPSVVNTFNTFLPPPPLCTTGTAFPPPNAVGFLPPPAMDWAPSESPTQFIRPSTGAPTLQNQPRFPTGLSLVGSDRSLVTPFRPQMQGQLGTGPYPSSINAVAQNVNSMNIHDSQRVINLLNERHLIPPDGIETVKPTLPQNFKNVNCSPHIFRCTLNAVPHNSTLLNKTKLPLGILIHPFKDLSQLPVLQTSVIVRCQSCRSYINPFVVFTDQGKWRCNLCCRENDLPDEFYLDPVSKTYGDPQRRPEVRFATIEFIAPSDYMLRPPQPAVYLFLLDVSFNAVETEYLSQFCQVLIEEIDKLPGDARTTIGFLCYDIRLYYFNLADSLSRPQMLCVPDLVDPFLPSPDSLLVNLQECKELVVDLLNQLPKLFEGNHETSSALGVALQSAHKLMSPTGGRITVMQTCLPTIGAGTLQNRDAGNTSEKDGANIGPATDFYKKLSLDCSARQITVDIFMLNSQYSDIATLSCISKYSSGCVYYYPSFHAVRNPGLVGKFKADFCRYLTRQIGFESVLRIRCTKGLSIHTFHGNAFVRSTDLLSLPSTNPDAGFGMQLSIEGKLADSVSFQAALLYTSTKGERRIRVHTLYLPVTDQLSEVFASADQLAIASLLTKMAVDRSLNTTVRDARESMISASLDALMAYNQQIPASQQVGALLAPYSLRLLPMLMLAVLKNLAFILAGNTPVDDRVFAMQQFKVLPVHSLIQNLIPHLYPLHKLNDKKPIKDGKKEIPSAPLLPLSSGSIDSTGLYLLDTGEAMYLLVGSEIEGQLCQDVFGKSDFSSLPESMMDLPELENSTSRTIHSFIKYLRDSRPHGITFLVIRGDSQQRQLFTQNLLEDRTENSMSYYEFLQFLKGKAKA